MKLSLKSPYFVSLVLIALSITSCYPAHSGSSGSLSGTGGSTSGSGSGSGSGAGSGSGSGTSTTFTVGGTVIGLVGIGMVLQDNGGDSLPVTASGGFTFKTA